jgi:hypothetical protein
LPVDWRQQTKGNTGVISIQIRAFIKKGCFSVRFFFHAFPQPTWGRIRNTLFENSMSPQSPKPRFERRPVRGMPPRVASYCLLCGEFVAASDKRKMLKIAEKAHVCPNAKT